MGLVLVLCAMLGQGAADLRPIPNLTALSQAHKLIEDVYGRRIEAAKAPAQKAAIAEEILRVAEREANQANRYAGLQVAKRLAVEAENGKVGLAVVERFAAEFQPTLPREADAWLPAADKAWEEAGQKKGSERLAGRLDAAECWLRAGEAVQAGFAAVKWRERIAELEGGGAAAVAAKADDAKPVDARTLKLLRAINGKTVIIVNKKSGLGMHVAEASKAANAGMIQSGGCEARTDAHWTVHVINGRWCRFKNVNSQLWLGEKTGSPNIPKMAIQTELQEAGNDWELKWADNDTVAIMHRATGLCLSPWRGAIRQGYGIHLYDFVSQPHLEWRFLFVH